MRIIIEREKKNKNNPMTSGYNGVMGFRLSRGKYSDAVLLGIFKKIFKRLDMVDYKVSHSSPIMVGMVNYFLNNKLNVAFSEMFNNGYLLFLKKVDHNGKVIGLHYVHKSEATSDGAGFTYEGQPLEVFYSDTFEVFGMSDAALLRDSLKALDNSINASQTIIKRLGAVIVGTPEQPTSNPQSVIISDDDKKKLEEEVQTDYGVLEEQKQFLFLRRPLKLQRIALGGKDLLITENVEMFIKILCDALNVPYDVMAISGQSTFANMEQAEKSMQDTAEAFISKMWGFFNSYGVVINWKVNNNKYGKIE